MAAEFEPGSFRDPHGRVLLSPDGVYRALSETGAEDWRALSDSGLLAELESRLQEGVQQANQLEQARQRFGRQAAEEHRDEIEATDIYTLRRIVPRDRGRSWGDR